MYYAVRQQYMKVLLEMEQSNKLDEPPIITINKMMSKLSETGKIKDKYYQLRRYQLQGCINNLFKIRKDRIL